MHISKEVVIQNYLKGKSYDQISKENNISKGSVSNVIRDWRFLIGAADIQLLRDFSVTVRKSGITIEQCAQGFRFIQILSNFGISDEPDADHDLDFEVRSPKRWRYFDETTQITGSVNTKKSSHNNFTTRDSFYQFIGDLYNYCKIHHINPSRIIEWIDDLVGFGSTYFGTSTNATRPNGASIDNSTNFPNPAISSVKKDYIPLISQFDAYIEQKKKEIKKLQNDLSALYLNIDDANKQNIAILEDLKKTTEKEKSVMAYLKWYDSIKQELKDKYDLIIEEEFEAFAKAVTDFKEHNFDVLGLINDYEQIESLRRESDRIQAVIDLNTPLKIELLKQVTIAQDKLSNSLQTMDTYDELSKIGFGLKELKQLYKTVLEISEANNMMVLDALPKFLRDVESQYDDKLGFENTINNIKTEMEKLKAQVPEYKSYLALQGVVSPIINYLNSQGISAQEILNLHNLVHSFQNSKFLDDNDIGEIGSSNTKKQDPFPAFTFWRLFTEKLRRLRTAQSEIDKKLSISNDLEEQIDRLDARKQETEKLCIEAAKNLNHVVAQTSYLIEVTRRINEEVNQRILNAPKINPVLLNLIVVENQYKRKDRKENNDVKK